MEENNRNLNSENIDEEITDELSYGLEPIEESVEEETEPEEKKSFAKEVYEWIYSIAVAVVLAFVINTFFFSLVQVDGESMLPTLQHGERLVVRKIAYTPDNLDVVIVKSEPLQKYIVKRIIATPSQEIAFDSDLRVVVDGTTIEETYINGLQLNPGNMYDYPITVPQKGAVADLEVILAERNYSPDKVSIEAIGGKIMVSGSSFVEDGEFIPEETTYTQNGYFVLGDNRNNSLDSRFFGFVPEDEIVGSAIFRFYPFSALGIIK